MRNIGQGSCRCAPLAQNVAHCRRAVPWTYALTSALGINPDGTYVGTLPDSFTMPLQFLHHNRAIFATNDSLDVQRLVTAETRLR